MTVAMWVRTLLFAVGLIIAITGGAYMTGLYNPWAEQPAESVASAPDSAPTQTKADETANGAGQETATSDEPTEPMDEKQARLPAPGFDILRVEPDGSVLVAGKARKLAVIEVLKGGEVLAKTTANDEGDFVIVLDTPLGAGDYALALRATSPDGEVTESSETAIISIPETRNGPVLAMIEQPGAPAQVVTLPEAASGESEATAAPSTAEGENAAATQPESQQGDAASADAGQQQQQMASQTTDNGSEPAAAPQNGQKQPSENAASSAQNGGKVVVEAVEIEGNKIFVAGIAEAGRTVRVYAGDQVLGDARVSSNGRFLVEAQRELAVGDYMIRADVLGADGSVISRAAVPFTRDAGETVSAVARAPSQDTNNAAGGQGAEQTASAGQGGDNATVAVGEDATAPRLQRVDGSVIIRRGDTLWHISRRVYGKGIRYSTIYLANQDQIRDPDLILPGQVFTVPVATEQGEEADLKVIEERNAQQETQTPSVQ